MSVYIKGMDMPKNCEECAIKSWDTVDYVCPFSGVPTLCIGRQDDCPLIPIPDHGRLIDADALQAECFPEPTFIAEMLFRKVNNAPTIIPADKEAEP